MVPSSTATTHSQKSTSPSDGEPNLEIRPQVISIQTLLFSVGISYELSVNISVSPARKDASTQNM